MDIFSTTNLSSVVGGATTSVAGSNMATLTAARGKLRLKQELEVVGDSYSGRFRDIGDQLASLQRLQSGISGAVDTLKGAKSSAESLKNLFDQMLGIVNTAADPANAEVAGRQFQAQMVTLRSMTSSSNGNMLSGPDQRVAYDINAAGVQMEVLGQNLGATYTIAASDGKVWAPDQWGGSLIAYDEYPATSANMSSGFHGGTRLNSLGADGTIDFTVMVKSATPQNLTGTLTAKGSGVFDAWVYDDLATADGRERATSDLEAAKGVAKAESLRYESAAAMGEYYYDKMQLAINVLMGEQQTLTEEQALKAAELQDKFNQSQAALTLALQGAANAGVQLLSVLPASDTVLNPAGSSQPLFDIFA